MVTTSVTNRGPVAAEYYEAADRINREFGPMNPEMDAKTLMEMAIASFDADELCARFELGIRAARRIPIPANPVFK